jgi:hypothetical protein
LKARKDSRSSIFSEEFTIELVEADPLDRGATSRTVEPLADSLPNGSIMTDPLALDLRDVTEPALWRALHRAVERRRVRWVVIIGAELERRQRAREAEGEAAVLTALVGA